jgi:CheY-like chemotaxis protein
MRRYRIILVENDEDEQFFMKEGFDTAGIFDVLAVVSNGNELFKWLHNNPTNLPDVILSDLNMPGKNGYDIIAEMRNTERLRDIPVIITSTSSTKTFIDKCIAIGAAAYMVKPETFVEYAPFVQSVHNLIEERGLVK